MKNNIFSFATSELSQDAFICWLANGFNCDSRALKELAIAFIKEVSGENDIRKVEIKRQYKKIDVLLLVNDVVAVIIEDKTFTGEHGNQISRYKDEIRRDDKYKNYEVRVVFLKTGFMYDNDRKTAERVKQDKETKGTVIDREFLIDFLSKHKTESEILENYFSYLCDLKKQDDEHGQYDNVEGNDFWQWNIARYHVAQYGFMREIFPDTQKDEIYHGSSSGRPWTEHVIHSVKDRYHLFWRVDTDTKGPYISLRVYPDDKFFDKSDDYKEKVNQNRYKYYSRNAEEYFEHVKLPIELNWEEIYPGQRGNYREAAIISIHLDKYLHNWLKFKDSFIETVKEITEKFQNDICFKVDSGRN